MPNKFRTLYLSVTGRCNLHCRHCYVTDSNKISEPTLDQIDYLFKESKLYGIDNVKITGGEPFIRDDILDILELMKTNNLNLKAICSNGTLINDEHIESMKEFSPAPYVKLSFDGIGYHDWIRNREDIESDTLDLVERLKSNGLRVWINYCLNKYNADCAVESAKELSYRGADVIRFFPMRMTERVVENNLTDAHLSDNDFLNALLSVVKGLSGTEVDSVIVLMGLATFNPKSGVINPKGYRWANNDEPMCPVLCNEIYIDTDGALYPCPTMSVAMRYLGWKFENVYTDPRPFHELLEDSECAKVSRSTISDLIKNNQKCANCHHVHQCRGGCRTLALGEVHMIGGDQSYYRPSSFMCNLYKSNYIKLLRKVLTN